MAKIIKQYDFWDYSLHERLFLSEKEEAPIHTLIQTVQQEYQANIDRFSKKIILSQIESLLNYAERFYHRQFITREKANHQILDRLEKLLNNYFANDDSISSGLPNKCTGGSIHWPPIPLFPFWTRLAVQATEWLLGVNRMAIQPALSKVTFYECLRHRGIGIPSKGGSKPQANTFLSARTDADDPALWPQDEPGRKAHCHYFSPLL